MSLAFSRHGALMRDGSRMIVRDVVGADPVVKKPWGPYDDEEQTTHAIDSLLQAVVPDWTRTGQLGLLGIFYGESRYGVTPDWQYPDGTPSWNMGAVIRGTSAGPTLPHPDHDAMGKPITQAFAAFPNPTEAIQYYVRNFQKLKGGVEAMQAGNARAVAEAMYASCWFSGTCPPSCTDAARIEAYARAIVGQTSHVAKVLGETSKMQLGQIVGLPLGKCTWHDGYVGKGGSGGSSSDGGVGAGGVVFGLFVAGGIGLAVAKSRR